MFPILAGWGTDAKVIAYLGLAKCHNCRNYDHIRLVETSKKITAFFVPVARWGKKYFIVCNTCGAAAEVDRVKKDDLLRLSLQLPTAEIVVAIWNAIDKTIATAAGQGKDVLDALETTKAALRQEHDSAHVDYVLSVYAECLRDPNKPE